MDRVLCRFADGRIVSSELVIAVRGGGGPSALNIDGLSGDAKLRRVGPMTSASGTCCDVAGARDAGVVWAGGLHSGWNARMRAGWRDPCAPVPSPWGGEGGRSPSNPVAPSIGKEEEFCLLSRLPPSGGRGSPWTPGPGGVRPRVMASSSALAGLSFLVVCCRGCYRAPVHWGWVGSLERGVVGFFPPLPPRWVPIVFHACGRL